MKTTPQGQHETFRNVIMLHLSGYTAKQISQIARRSPARVHQILAEYQEQRDFILWLKEKNEKGDAALDRLNHFYVLRTSKTLKQIINEKGEE